VLDIALLSDPSRRAEADGASSSLKEKRKFELEEGVEARGGEGRKKFRKEKTTKKRGKLRHSK
jgi:hypothetical protein